MKRTQVRGANHHLSATNHDCIRSVDTVSPGRSSPFEPQMTTRKLSGALEKLAGDVLLVRAGATSVFAAFYGGGGGGRSSRGSGDGASLCVRVKTISGTTDADDGRTHARARPGRVHATGGSVSSLVWRWLEG